jgi:CRP/FNR family transcriptional regulator, cyclic AMP receptor protein
MDAAWVDQLAKVPVFAGLKPPALELVALVANEEVHERESLIFEHGQVGDKLYVILEGKVRIGRQLAGMGEEALAILEPGAVFGEMALLDDTPRSADARAHGRCRLLAISREAFEDLLFLHKDLAYEVLWNIVHLLSTRLRETNDKLAMLTFSSKF